MLWLNIQQKKIKKGSIIKGENTRKKISAPFNAGKEAKDFLNRCQRGGTNG
jgi:hypothetical protein